MTTKPKQTWYQDKHDEALKKQTAETCHVCGSQLKPVVTEEMKTTIEAMQNTVRVCLKHCLHEVVENPNSELYHSIGEDCPTVIANLLEDMK